MVTDAISIALTYVQVVALTLPVLAILMQAMVTFRESTGFKESQSTSGVHKWLVNKRFSFLFYSFTTLYVILGDLIWNIYNQMGKPLILFIPTVGFAIAFGLLLAGLAGFMWNLENHSS